MNSGHAWHSPSLWDLKWPAGQGIQKSCSGDGVYPGGHASHPDYSEFVT